MVIRIYYKIDIMLIYIVFSFVTFYFLYNFFRLLRKQKGFISTISSEKTLIIDGKIDMSNDIWGYFCYMLYKQYISNKKKKAGFSIEYKDNKTYFIFNKKIKGNDYRIYLIKYPNKTLFYGYKNDTGFYIITSLILLQKIEIKYNIDFYGKKYTSKTFNRSDIINNIKNIKYYYTTFDNNMVTINYITSNDIIKTLPLDYFIDIKKRYANIYFINNIINYVQ